MIDPIVVRGAREHNLKNISLDIPAQKFVVITGPSGSGKSSLAFDTIFAEGQRRYIESLSAYARQFMEQLSKPDVDYIDGLSPSISIDQKTVSSHPRSTVGTVTSIYDFLRLLYARTGKVLDPTTGEALEALDDEEIVRRVLSYKEESKIQLFASVVRGKKGEYLREMDQWRRLGYSKILIDGQLRDLHDPILLNRHQHHDIDILIDSIIPSRPDAKQRILESVRICDKISGGHLRIINKDSGESLVLGKKIALPSTGRSFPELEPRLFSFNSPYGMCPECRGLGTLEDTKPSSGKSRSKEEDDDELADDEEIQVTCPACKGLRLNPDSLSVFYDGKTIAELSALSAEDLLLFFENSPTYQRSPVAKRLGLEIISRLQFLVDVGLPYLSLSRNTGTLSGGEAQRIRLATQLGIQLSGVLYVLDEPSIGLHPLDHAKLLASLEKLRDLGNSVIVVEHDEETILAADEIIEIGPGAGVHGGTVIAQATPKEFLEHSKCKTAEYLRGDRVVTEQRARRPARGSPLKLSNCTGHNLQNVTLSLPLGTFVVFTGVSGSGKSSLIHHTMLTELNRKFYRSRREPLPFKNLSGESGLDKVVTIDQRAIGRSPRSNPATYTGIFSLIRSIYSQSPEAQLRGYTPGTFSFNVKGGRCDGCEGAGRKKIEMHFLPDVFVPCEVCNGQRYRREVLEVRFKGKSISEVLEMSIEEAYEIFAKQPQIEPKLKTLLDVGLGYIRLGQSATTLSGGEAQRVKLAKELSKRSTGKTLYFLDEPTTGLHFEDVQRLLEILQRLTDLGNTIVVIEHNLDVICAADWIVELGPGAGKKGGLIIAEGTPEDFNKKFSDSPTGSFVAKYFRGRRWN
jgi:excinuclease ABC subunit A